MYFSWFILDGISPDFFLNLLIFPFFSRCEGSTHPLPTSDRAAAPAAVLARPVHHGVASRHQRAPGRRMIVVLIIIIISSKSIIINIVIQSSIASSQPSFLYIPFLKGTSYRVVMVFCPHNCTYSLIHPCLFMNIYPFRCNKNYSFTQ